MSTVTCCPYCARQPANLLPTGSVFIEAGEWDGKRYVDEGDYPRWLCNDCGRAFGEMPVPDLLVDR